jgi:RND superfamily putative drug exporter
MCTITITRTVFDVVIGMPIFWMVPLMLFVMIIGLGLDYTIFLTTRIREEVSKGKTDEEAIVMAVKRTGGIITLCGLVMTGAFGSVTLSTLGLLEQFGFALAFAVVLAVITQLYLLPAAMVLSKKYIWWAPRKLQRTGESNTN